MSHRDDALRSIFDATGVSGRLTDDQKRELLAHLEDAVEKKAGAGVPEMEAVGQAFAELGPLPRIADQLSLRGRLLDACSRGAAAKGVALLAIFSFIQAFLTPKFAHFMQETGVQMPGLMAFFVQGTGLLGDGAVLIGTVLVAIAVLQIVGRRKGWPAAWQTRLKLSALGLYGLVATLCVGLVLGCGFPTATLFGTLLR